MQSVFPQSELLRFMKQTRFDKKAQVRAILSDNHVYKDLVKGYIIRLL